MRAVAIAFALVLSAVSLSADTWPHWRGPAASGIAVGALPAAWSSTQNVAWSMMLEGSGVSSPVVTANRVFVTSQAGDGRRQDGRHPTLAQGVDPASAGEATLARRTRRDTVTFIVEAFDRATGKRVWSHETPAEGELPPVHDKHNLSSASPVTTRGSAPASWWPSTRLASRSGPGTWRATTRRSKSTGATPARRRCSTIR